MHRFYLPPGECAKEELFLRGREAHHALRVLRLRRGDRVAVLDGAGGEFRCDVEEYDRDKVKLAIVEKLFVPPLPYQITLFQALPKGKIIESIIQKATELGVYRIVPLLSERVLASGHMDAKAALNKADKWRTVAIEAIKQCGSPWLPQIEGLLTPKQFLARKESFELPLIASLQPGSRHPREYFEDFRVAHKNKPKTISIWVGPEGDFSKDEVELITSAGALPISLGRLILRVETAAVYCLSILNYELQSSGSSNSRSISS